MAAKPLSSEIWNYFDRDTPKKGKATCKLCPGGTKTLTFNGSTTSNLWAHVHSQHDRHVKVKGCSRSPGPSQSKASPMAAFLKRTSCSEGRSRQITQLLAWWCARNVRPMSIVDDEGLHDLVAFLEPGYRMPSRTHITTVLRRQYDITLAKVRELLNEDRSASLSFTTDIWTSAAVDAYLTLTGHFLTADFSLVSCCLGTSPFPERHTGVNIAGKVSGMLEQFKVPVVRQVALVHDQAANMEAAGRSLESSNPAFTSVVCAPHRLQNTVKAGLEVDRVSRLLASARRIVTHFKHSVVAMEALRKLQKEKKDKKLKLVQDVATRWNSTMHMLERLVQLRPHISAVLKDAVATPKPDDRKRDLSPEQYGLIESLLEVLRPFERATTILSAEKAATISCVLHFALEIADVLEVVDSDSVTMAQVKGAMLKDLNKRFGLKPFDCDALEAKALLLDPRFHHGTLLSRLAYDEIVTVLNESLTTMFPDADLSADDESHTQCTDMPPAKRKRTALEMMCVRKLSADAAKKKPAYVSLDEEFRRFLAEDEIDINADPLDWWKSHAAVYPHISQLARRLLAVPASSTSSERMCSTSGHVAEQTRSTLTPRNVNMLVFLNKNAHLCSLKGSAAEPIPVPQTESQGASPSQVEQESGDELDVEVDDDCPDLPQLPALF